MNILMVSPYFYPDGGGAEFYLYKIVEGLSKEHEVTVLCTGNSKTEFNDNIKIFSLRHDFKISTSPVSLTAVTDVASHIKKANFDVCNINYYLPYFPDVAAIVSKIYNLPSVMTWHNDVVGNGMLRPLASIYNNTLNKITLNVVDKIITPSPYCYNESPFLKDFRDKMVWIPPGVDLEKYERTPTLSIREKYGIKDYQQIILFVGVMNKSTAHKGVNILLKAFQKIYNKYKDAILLMVGKGDMVSYYKKCCKSLGINDRVIFTGFVDETVLINIYRASEVLVLPSTTVQEGFGMVLIEANACGKPVIGSRIGGIKYVIKEGVTGLLATPKDPDSLADAISYLLENPSKANKMGKKGRKMVENHYGWHKVVEKTFDVFSTLEGVY